MTAQTHRIAVLGAGSWGSALALALSRNGHTVNLWGRDAKTMQAMDRLRCNPRYLPGLLFPEHLHACADWAQALEQVDLVLIAVPSRGFRSILEKLSTHMPASVRGVVWATKGLDPQQGCLLHEVFEAHFPEMPYAILTGPSFAMEVASDQLTAVSLASTAHTFSDWVAALFWQARFRVYPQGDIIGSEVGGAVKNVLAVAAGIAEGLSLGANAKAALLTRGLLEMTRLAEALGGLRETLSGLSGFGDLVLTCGDNQSRNRRFGLALGQGKSVQTARESIQQTVESINTTYEIHRLAEALSVDMPICHAVYEVLRSEKTPQEAMQSLLEREPKPEF